MNNITKLKAVYVFSSLYFYHPIITLFYIARGLDLFQIVALEAALCAAIVLLEVPSGVIADKFGRKHSLCILLCSSIVAGVWTVYADSYVEFLLIQAVYGLGLASGSGAVEALVYDELGGAGGTQDMSRVWGSINAGALFARVAAVVAGGFLARDHNPQHYTALFWLYAGGNALALGVAVTMKEPERDRHTNRISPFRLLSDSVRQIMADRSLRRVIFLSSVTFPFVQVIAFLIQPYFQLAGVPGEWWGVVMALGNLLAAFFLTHAHLVERRLGLERAVLVTTVLPGLLYLLMVFLVGPVLSCLWYVGLRGVSNLREPLLSKKTNEKIHSYNRATVLSVISLFQSLYSVANKLLLGWLADTNLLLAFLVMGLVIVVGAMIFRIDKDEAAVLAFTGGPGDTNGACALVPRSEVPGSFSNPRPRKLGASGCY